MSTVGPGIVVALPVAAGVAAAGICIVAGSMAVMACGQGVLDVINANAARRRAMVDLSSRHRQTQLQWAQVEAHAQLTQAMHQALERARQAAQTQAAVNQPLDPTANLRLQARTLAEQTAASAPGLVGGMHLTERLKRLSAWRAQLQQAIELYAPDAPWGGLFSAEDLHSLRATLNQVRVHLENSQGSDNAEYSLAEKELADFSAQLMVRRRQALARWDERSAARKALEKANLRLSQITTDELSPEVLTDLSTAAAALNEAADRLAHFDFANARARADLADQWLQAVQSDNAQATRSTHLQELLQTLEHEAENYVSEAKAQPLRQFLEQASRHLTRPDQDLDLTQTALENAGREADNLADWVRQEAAGAFIRDRLALLAIRQLRAMGYDVFEKEVPLSWQEDASTVAAPFGTTPQDMRRLVGRQGERQFVLEIKPDGTLWFDVRKGYLGKACTEALETFVSGLRALGGFDGVFQTSFAAADAVEILKEVAINSGYGVREEETPEGRVLLLEREETSASFIVGWDGQIEPTSPLELSVAKIFERVRLQNNLTGRTEGIGSAASSVKRKAKIDFQQQAAQHQKNAIVKNRRS